MLPLLLPFTMVVSLISADSLVASKSRGVDFSAAKGGILPDPAVVADWGAVS